MSDDLVKRLRDGKLTWGDRWEAADRIEELVATIEELEAINETLRSAQSYTYIGKDGKSKLARDMEDRIEELEAKLAEANMKLAAWKAWASGEPSNPPKTGVKPVNLADMKGGDG